MIKVKRQKKSVPDIESKRETGGGGCNLMFFFSFFSYIKISACYNDF